MTSPDFGHLAKHDVVPAKAVPYTFFEIEGEPTLTVRVVGEKNKPLFRKIQRRAGSATNRPKLTSMQLQLKIRRNARELFAGPDGCIDDWPTPPADATGTPVEFTVGNCTAFLHALPDHLLDGLINFVAAPENFTGDDEISEEAASELGEVSEPDSSGS